MKISSGGSQGRRSGRCGDMTDGFIVWAGLSFDDEIVRQQWTLKSLSLADQIKYKILTPTPPPCFLYSVHCSWHSHSSSSLFLAAPVLLHPVFWMLCSCQTLQSEFSPSYTTLSIFLQIPHFPTIFLSFCQIQIHTSNHSIFSYWLPLSIFSIKFHASPLIPWSLKLFPHLGRLFSLHVVMSYLVGMQLPLDPKCLLSSTGSHRIRT